MSRVRKILLSIVVAIVLIIGLFILFIGPWPVYRSTDYKNTRYYRKTVEELQSAQTSVHLSESPGELKAGWAYQILTPPVGTPLGGYSGRKGKPSTGVHDELYAKTIVLSDGVDTVAIVGTDLLLVPPNVAELVRKQVKERVGLTPQQIYFTASHTHCGPGAWAPGLAGRITGGKYNPAVVEHLAKYIAESIIEAYQRVEPAQIAHSKVDAKEYIRNRTREAPIDSDLNFALVEQTDGDRCFVVRFSAHPTIYDEDMMQFSAEYPGALQKTLERHPKTTAIYLGGALGSSGPRAPQAPDVESRVRLMGEQLAELVLAQVAFLKFTNRVEIASLGFLIHMPSFQVRPVSATWRLSPLAGKIMGVPPYGWFQACRIGDLLLVGLPFDFSSETSLAWKLLAQTMDIELWTTSFSSAYCGYLSPDKYYWVEPLNYETGLMSWFGPSCEAYMEDLYRQCMRVLFPQIQQAKTVSN